MGCRDLVSRALVFHSPPSLLFSTCFSHLIHTMLCLPASVASFTPCSTYLLQSPCSHPCSTYLLQSPHSHYVLSTCFSHLAPTHALPSSFTLFTQHSTCFSHLIHGMLYWLQSLSSHLWSTCFSSSSTQSSIYLIRKAEHAANRIFPVTPRNLRDMF